MARARNFLLWSSLFSCSCAGSNGLDADAQARRYLELALAWDAHDAGYVDAYYGPALDAAELDAVTTRARAAALRDALADGSGERAAKLHRLAASLVGRIDVVEGRIHRFDDEARAVIGVVPPRIDPPESQREPVERLVVPRDAIATVLEAALAECRRRSMAHFDLPEDESVRLELVHGEPWAAYHHYEGRYQSTVAFNLDFPLYIDRALEEMCHEGYPGHHVQQVLMERHLVEERGLVEYALLPAYGPVPFLAEGGASYAVKLVFPEEERTRFERDVLFPLAGLDPELAQGQAAERRARRALDPLILEAARRNLDGELDLYNAVFWLEARGVASPRSALEYAWIVRSHLASYTFAETLVRAHVETRVAAAGGTISPIDALTEIWTTPLFPEEL